MGVLVVAGRGAEGDPVDRAGHVEVLGPPLDRGELALLPVALRRGRLGAGLGGAHQGRALVEPDLKLNNG